MKTTKEQQSMDKEMKQEKIRKEMFREVAEHEAGHLLLNWYAGLKPSRTVAYDEFTGVCYATKDKGMRHDQFGLRVIGGYAANYLKNPEDFTEEILYDFADFYHIDMEEKDDIYYLWSCFKQFGIQDEAVYNTIVSYFFNAVTILKQYKKEWLQAADLLERNHEITYKEAWELFKCWGKPKNVDVDYGSISRYWIAVPGI